MERLTRSTTDKMIAGVLGGVARYIKMDVTVVRLLFVVLTIFTGVGPGLLAYLVAMFVMPSESSM